MWPVGGVAACLGSGCLETISNTTGALYNYFKKRRPHLALKIVSNSIFALVSGILNALGIKKVIKKWRARMFPGKYFEY
jgi:branched-subunit amino acid permease